MQRQRTGIFRIFQISGKSRPRQPNGIAFAWQGHQKIMPDTRAPGMIEVSVVQQGRVSYFVFTWLLNFGPK